jgi:predicted phage terminase large subunit-like protein
LEKVLTAEEKLKLKCYKDPFFFIKNILGYKDMEERLHGAILDHVLKPGRKKLLLLPRGHFKTTVTTIGLPIWLILNDPNVRININNKILKNSKAFLREIKEHFTKNEKLLYLFGDWKGPSWREDEIIVNKRTKHRKEPTIKTGAVDHELTSGHYDWIINDDLAGLMDMVSEAEREKTLRFYRSTTFIGDRDTVRVNIGTRKALTDLYSHITTEIPEDQQFIRKAIITEDVEPLKDGKALFPEYWTLDALLEMYNEDPVIFEAEMQNNPTAFDNQLYELKKLTLFENDAISDNGHHVAYVDPAFGKNEKGEPCYFSLIIGRQIGSKIYIVDWITNRRQPQENEALIISKIKEYRFNRLGIESNAQQTEFIRNVERGIQEHNDAHMQPEDKIFLGIEYINHTVNKDRRIQAMHGTVINSFEFRRDWANAYNEGMNQLILYPHHKFKDAPDALAGLVEMVQNFDPFAGSTETLSGGHTRKKESLK